MNEAGFRKAHMRAFVHVTYTVTKCAHMRFTKFSLKLTMIDGIDLSIHYRHL